jgi:hypothetical protein
MMDNISLLPDTISENKIRFDKNIAKSGIDLDTIYGEDGQVIFDLLIYIASDFQKNIFDYGNIDLVSFAKASGQHASNLQRLHPHPAQLQHFGISKEDFEAMKKSSDFKPDEWFINYFENSLYKLGAINLALNSKYKDFSQDETVIETKFIQVLSDIRKHITRHNKAKYSFEVSEAFTVNLSKYFINVNISPEQKKLLRKNASTYLYFYLENLRSSLMVNDNKEDRYKKRISFNHLCKVAKLNNKDFRNNKQRLKKKIYDVALKTDLNVQIEFERVKPTSRYKAACVLIFPDNLKGIDDQETFEVLKKAFTDLYLHKLKLFYRESFPKRGKTNIEDFMNWYFSKEHSQEKEEFFYSIKEKIYGKKAKNSSFVAPSINKPNIDKYIKEIYSI